MDLENRKNELSRAFLNNEPININVLLENGETQVKTINPNDLDYVSSYHKESEYLNKQIRKNRLESDYANKRPLMYHFIDDDGQEDDIMLDSSDINYKNAYKQQLETIERGVQVSEDEVEAVLNQVHKDIELDAETDKIMAELYANRQENKMSEGSSTPKADNNDALGTLPSVQENKSTIIENQDDIKDDKKPTENESTPNFKDDKKLAENESTPDFQDRDFAIFKSGNVIRIVGDIVRGKDDEVLKYLLSHSEICKNRDRNHDKIQIVNKSARNKKYTFADSDAEIIFDANGNFKIDGADEVEQHRYLQGKIGANKDIDVQKVLEYAKNGQKKEIIDLVKEKGYRYVKDAMYDAIDADEALSRPSVANDYYYDFLDIVNEAFNERGELKFDDSIDEPTEIDKPTENEPTEIDEPVKDEESRIKKPKNKPKKDEYKANDELLRLAREGKITWREYYENYNLPQTAIKVTVKEAKPSSLNKLKNNISNLNGLQKASFIFGIMSGIGTGHYLLNKKYAAKVNGLLFGNKKDSKSNNKGGRR